MLSGPAERAAVVVEDMVATVSWRAGVPAEVGVLHTRYAGPSVQGPSPGGVSPADPSNNSAVTASWIGATVVPKP